MSFKAHNTAHGILFKKLQDIALSIMKAVHKAEREQSFLI
jgi:hypothetical protein